MLLTWEASTIFEDAVCLNPIFFHFVHCRLRARPRSVTLLVFFFAYQAFVLSSHIYFSLFETPIVTLWSSCAPKHVLWQRVFRSGSEFKVRNLILWTGHWLFALASSLHSADELQQERNSCPLLRSCFIGSCHVGVSKRFSRSISLAVFCLYAFHFGWSDLLSRSYVGSVYRMRSFAVSY